MSFDESDHRALGERLDLFHFAPEAPGMAYWHPRGWAAYRALEAAVRQRLREEGFEEVRYRQKYAPMAQAFHGLLGGNLPKALLALNKLRKLSE